ncbi:MAG: ATP-binding protein [Candidatus Bathyarchaeia archaeon]
MSASISFIKQIDVLASTGIELIKEVEFSNFKGIEKGKIELHPLTILIGSNNAAKSTILEALFLAPNPFRNVPYFIPESQSFPSKAIEPLYYIHRTLDYQGYAFLMYNYTSDNAKITITLDHPDEAGSNQVELNLLKRQQTIFFRSNKSRNRQISIANETMQSFGEVYVNGLSLNIADARVFSEQTLLVSPKLTRPAYEYLKREWASIVNTRVSKRIAKEISKLSPEQYADFTMEPVIGGQLDINAYLEDGRRIRLGDLGEGIQSYLLTRILFEIYQPKVLLWDDIESHLNPRMLITIADWFSDLIKSGHQVIISTHSLELARVIGGVNEEETKICLTSLKNSELQTKLMTLKDLENYKALGVDARTAEALL